MLANTVSCALGRCSCEANKCHLLTVRLVQETEQDSQDMETYEVDQHEQVIPPHISNEVVARIHPKTDEDSGDHDQEPEDSIEKRRKIIGLMHCSCLKCG